MSHCKDISEDKRKDNCQDNRKDERDGKPRAEAVPEQEPPHPSEDGESFLQRWSRRKHRAARDEQQADTGESGPGADGPAADSAAAPAEIRSESEVPAKETPEPEPPGDDDMPPLDSIDQGGSVRDFFSPNVSKKLRGAALKRLFSQPEFSAPDLLEEYAGDYSKPTPLGDTVTAEMRYRAEQALKFAERKLKAAAEQAGEDQPAGARPPAAVPKAAEHGKRSAAVDAARHPNPAQAPKGAPVAESESAESEPSEREPSEDAEAASRPEDSDTTKPSR